MLDAHDVRLTSNLPRFVEVVETFRRLGEVAEQFRRRDARLACCHGILETVEQGAVGQFHRDDEVALLLPGRKHGQQMRVAHLLQEVEGAQFSSGPGLQRHELAGDRHVARGRRPPDFAETAFAQTYFQLVTGDRLRTGLEGKGNDRRGVGILGALRAGGLRSENLRKTWSRR
ncbi:MAG TPA: hypothetical protein VEL76_04880 [Gemmataceae bacterium]|nr:hypothetical protein [Gemmataceae bacterium]